MGLQTIGIGGASYVGGQIAKVGTYNISKDVFELTESQAESNARIAEIFGTIATGIAVAKPVQKVVTNKFGLNSKVMDFEHCMKSEKRSLSDQVGDNQK